ncbi:winged helix-turn-helix domain-containing protein [Acrocarpospora catenulata]|uniref:winged helix-turn-helix domain-containing protein n=1 Tax=Acrocarpospora catenulata TaxID=2836182 RepID=UPI001BD9C0B4|nr:winged helix-turn-helix domain-containing protein [Acrocarpospora catenulata]
MNDGSDRSGQGGLIRRTGSEAVYLQIADIIARRIVDGDLRPGDRVPSESEVVQQFGVVQMTARRVHQELRERGLSHTVPGEGSFVGPEGTPKADHLRPMYVQIADTIVKEIRAGEIAPEGPIPGEAKLMARHGVAKATIRHSIALLREAGWVITIPYQGTFVAPQDSWPEQPG